MASPEARFGLARGTFPYRIPVLDMSLIYQAAAFQLQGLGLVVTKLTNEREATGGSQAGRTSRKPEGDRQNRCEYGAG